jgi:multidrug efflux pump subunit AcrB
MKRICLSRTNKIIVLTLCVALVIGLGVVAIWREFHPRYTSTSVILIEEQRPPVPSSSCTNEQARKAEEEADTLKSWQLVHLSFENYARCDDGAIAEGYSDSISRLLADQWQQFENLQELAGQDPPFKEFVLRHVDESISAEQAKAIGQNARLRCPADGKVLCNEIMQRLISTNSGG